MNEENNNKQIKLFNKNDTDNTEPDELIYYSICNICKEITSICNKCNTLFEIDDEVYCIDIGENYRKHYCKKCVEEHDKIEFEA